MDTGQEGKDTGTRNIGCGRRLLRGCGFLVLALLLIVVTLFIGEICRCSHSAPSGDELYDRYAQAVIQRQAWKLFHNTGTHPATLPDELLDRWEADFGEDPRYWQLRYWCAKHRFDSFGIFSKHHPWDATQEPSQQEAEQYLEKARELAVADADTLWFLLQEERVDIRHSWSKVEQETEALTGDERRNKLQEHGRWAEEREFELLEAMVEAGPDEAWPYYWRAKYWFELGEQELAQADLQAGNKASDNHIPRLFPVSAVMQQQLGDNTRYGNQCVAGAVLEVYTFDAVTNWLKWQEVALEIQVAAALGGDLSLATDFHRFACRLGQAEAASHLESYFGQYLASLLPPYFISELSGNMSVGERRALWQIYRHSQYIERAVLRTDDQLTSQHPGIGTATFWLHRSMVSGGGNVHTFSSATMREYGWNALLSFMLPTFVYQHYCWIAQVQHESSLDLRESYATLGQADYEDLEKTVVIVW